MAQHLSWKEAAKTENDKEKAHHNHCTEEVEAQKAKIEEKNSSWLHAKKTFKSKKMNDSPNARNCTSRKTR